MSGVASGTYARRVQMSKSGTAKTAFLAGPICPEYALKYALVCRTRWPHAGGIVGLPS